MNRIILIDAAVKKDLRLRKEHILYRDKRCQYLGGNGLGTRVFICTGESARYWILAEDPGWRIF